MQQEPLTVTIEAISKGILDLVYLLEDCRSQCPCREISLAITKLEEGSLWLGKLLEGHQDDR